MSKDPAFLFYPGDWLGGTTTFTRAHKGAYMDLLMAQFNNGHMSLQEIKIILGNDFDEMWESVLKRKFKIDDKGLYYNEKLEKEMLKRKAFTESRKKNLESHKGSHMDNHMENENENRNIDININKEKGMEKENIVYQNSFFSVTEKQMEVYKKAYQYIDIISELKKMESWLISNPEKRKKKYPRFINNWLSNCKTEKPSEQEPVFK